MLIMRELTGGLYFGAHETGEQDGLRKATDIMTYDAVSYTHLFPFGNQKRMIAFVAKSYQPFNLQFRCKFTYRSLNL